MSLGFEQAGFDIAAAVETDPIHCAVHKFNFPKTRIIPYSVETLTGDQIRKFAKIDQMQIDCVFGGAPCQGFSLIGQRAMDDPRNKLVSEFVRLVTELDANSFVFENVKGLTVGKHKGFLSELIGTFEDAGYEILKPWNVLNAAHFGVPQYRERLFLLGVKRGRKLPEYPKPFTTPADGRKPIEDLIVGPTVADAIGDIPDADNYKTLLENDVVPTKLKSAVSAYACEMRCLSKDCWHYGYVREWDNRFLTSSARTLHTDISKRRFKETDPGTVEPISRYLKLSPSGISNTLRAGTDGSRGAFTSPRPIHYKFHRCITVREMARLHGFPDWFRFNITKWHGARQIGNAVPPPLARAVAKKMLYSLEKKPSRPEKTLPLGCADLLSFDLSKAAKYFDVERPQNRRNRKSGAVKRRQIDIERERLAVEGVASNG